MLALRKALELKPEVIFFLTDAEDMTRADVDEILAEVGSTRIQADRVRFWNRYGPAVRTRSARHEYRRYVPLHRR